ncbi:MAG: hypothetical protein BGO49_26230 [Planctomycetales bacterium 71-10]|nr:MAG: hypothetical protein BGO49_26230 [Planctomycetales bacterium 71-10]
MRPAVRTALVLACAAAAAQGLTAQTLIAYDLRCRELRDTAVRHKVRVFTMGDLDTAMKRCRMAYHVFMMEKYERASVWPWLPVSPDPPEPED